MGRGALMRCGLASWSQTRPIAAPKPPESLFPCGSEAPVLDSFELEVVRLIASLILSPRKEGLLHA